MKAFYWILLAFLSISICSGQDKEPEIRPLAIGAKVPEFHLKSVEGNFYSLDNFKDKDLLVVLFTCNHCPTAQAYEDKFNKIVKDYSSKNVGFVAISPNSNKALSLAEIGYSDLDDSYESMIIRAKEKDYKFPYLYDGDDHKYSLAFGPQATPHVFVFDKDRILKYRGRIDDTENPYVEAKTKDLINALDALIAGKDPELSSTKTFGCSIKWSWKNEWTENLKKKWAEEDVFLNEISLNDASALVANKSENLRLINIWATWCGPCVIEFPELIEIFRMYDGRSFEFISLSTDKIASKEKVLQFLEKNDAACKNYIYKGENVYDLIEVIDKEWQGTLPYTMLIEPGGKVIFKHSGAINPLEVKKAIVSSLGRYYADN